MSFAKNTPMDFVINLCLLDENESLFFRVRTSESLRCPLTVLRTAVLLLLPFSSVELVDFRFHSFELMTKLCFLFKCADIELVDPVRYLKGVAHSLHTVVDLSSFSLFLLNVKYSHTSDRLVAAILLFTRASKF